MTAVLLGAATTTTPAPGRPPRLAECGVDSFRFPVRWDRLQPAGRGELDAVALDAVTDILDRLDAAGTRAGIVLHATGLPGALAEAGGWLNRDTAHAFADFGRALARALGPRVDLWTTLDAPPGPRSLGEAGLGDALAAAHHMVLAHGLAARAIRGEINGARVSLSLPVRVTRPTDERDTTHLEAVRAVDLLHNHLFLGPLLDGSYPTALVAGTRHLSDWSFVRPGDLVTTRQRLDVLQVTYRDTVRVRPGPGGEIEEVVPPGATVAASTDPQGLTDLLRSVDHVFPDVPILVAVTCPRGAGGDVPDCPDYLSAHLARVEEASADGIAVRGLLVLDDGSEPVAQWCAGVLSRREAAQAAERAAAEAAAPERPGGARPALLRRLLRRRS